MDIDSCLMLLLGSGTKTAHVLEFKMYLKCNYNVQNQTHRAINLHLLDVPFII